MMKVTAWTIKHDDGSVSFNHIEDGWVDGSHPEPIKEEFANQKSWKNMKWVKEYAELTNGVITRTTDGLWKRHMEITDNGHLGLKDTSVVTFFD